jgi:hypothetical protein
VDEDNGVERMTEEPPQKRIRTSTGCCRCGSTSHHRTSHRECPLNARNANGDKHTDTNPVVVSAQCVVAAPEECIPTEIQKTVLWDELDLDPVARSTESDEESGL